MKGLVKKLFTLLPDSLFIKLKYYYHFKKWPSLNNPKTFNEKIQWLKLHDRKESYTKMADKYEMKKIVTDKIGEEFVIKNYGVWDSYEEIQFDILPEQFVLKTTHDCGGVVVCKDKNLLDHEYTKKILKKHLKYNYFYEGREWPYKNIKPRIIAEEYLENKEVDDLIDYKIFTFNGKAKMLFIATDRQLRNSEPKFDFYDMEFRHLDVINGHPNSNKKINKPIMFEQMKMLAEKLAEGIPHLRVDFYEINGKIYVGELTFFHYSGMVPFEPERWDFEIGSWLVLPK